MKKKYDESFRAGAVALAKDLGSVEDAAKQLSVAPSQIYRWRKGVQAEKKPPAAPKPAQLNVCPTCGAPVRLQYFNGNKA